MIDFLEWDSNFFCKKIYRVNIDTELIVPDELCGIISELQKLNAEVAYFMLSSVSKEWDLAFEISGVKCIDEKIVFEKNLIGIQLQAPNFNIEAYRGAINEDLIKIGLEAGKYSRFKKDMKFNGKYQPFYVKWIEKSLAGLIADTFLVYLKEGKIRGLITGKINGKIGTIGLIAAHPQAQRGGIGSSLLSAAEIAFAAKNANTAEVATQSENTSACAFYKKAGYHIKSVTPIYHYWL